MSKMTVAAQLYTLREYTQTPEDIANTLKKVKKMGYNAVQLSGLGPVEPDELKGILLENRINACATHVSFERLQNDLDNIIKEHKLWDCKYVGVGSMPGEYSKNKEGYLKFVREASTIGRQLQESGLEFIYHNHNFEFVKFGDKTGLDILFEESDPESFNFEIDTYWVQAGGADPASWINKVSGRMKVVHFKDMIVNNKGEQIMAEVGEGNLNWPAIIKACEDTGVEWCAVEQDVCQRNPFKSLEISLNNLKKMGLDS